MAGTRQHILPRFLLRGFQSNASGGQIRTWVQRKSQCPYETNILNVSVGRKFYDGGKDDVDEEITKLENRFAPVIEALRNESMGRTVSISEVPELIVHLSIRTKNLRDSLFDASDFLFSGLIKHLENRSNLVAIMRRAVIQKKRWFRELLEEKARGSGLSRKDIKHLWPHLEQKLLEEIENSPQEIETISLIKKYIAENLAEVLKSGHLKALGKTLIPEPRLEIYRNYTWHLVVWEGSSLVLGDAGPIHEIPEGFKAFPDPDNLPRSIYLPIGGRHLIAGTMCESLSCVDSEAVNKGQAMCANEYIVGSHEALVKGYEDLIGARAFIISKDDLDRMLSESLAGL